MSICTSELGSRERGKCGVSCIHGSTFAYSFFTGLGPHGVSIAGEYDESSTPGETTALKLGEIALNLWFQHVFQYHITC